MPENNKQPAAAIPAEQTPEKLILNLPYFSHLSTQEATELADLMEKIIYPAGTTIVTEGSIVNNIYIIVSGIAEVTTDTIREGKKESTLLATLEAEEAIGLAQEGFFSKTGAHTATVIAATEVHLLRLSVGLLQQFMKKHGKLSNEMQQTLSQMLRMAFLKQTAPFAHLSPEKIRQLLQHIGEMHADAGELIFREGDTGENCYFILSGKVEIFHTQPDGTHKTLAVLEPPTLFGELSLLSDKPRNATAQAMETTLLLTLSREHLLTFMEADINTNEAIMALSVERGRPKHHLGITVHHRTNSENESIYILKDPVHKRYYRLSKEGHFIWKLLDGNHTLKDITLALFQQFQIFSPEMVCRIIFSLASAGFVEIPSISTEEIRETSYKNMPLWVRALLKIRIMMEKQFAFSNTDKVLTQWYEKGFFICYTLPSQIVFSMLAILGFIAFLVFFKQAVSTIGSLGNAVLMMPYLIVASLIFIPLHELGHALTAKHFGREVNRMGIGWYWITPIAFADTSDMWLSDRWPRVTVNLAGIYVDAVIAGLASLIAHYWVDPAIGIYFWLFALGCYLDMFKNLDPLLEYDGYYALMDYLDRPNLRENAVIWLVSIAPKTFRHPRLIQTYWKECLYWISCIVFIILSAGVVYLIQHYFLFPLLSSQFVDAAKQYNLDWILPSIVIFISFLSVFAEIKYRKAQSGD